MTASLNPVPVTLNLPCTTILPMDRNSLVALRAIVGGEKAVPIYSFLWNPNGHIPGTQIENAWLGTTPLFVERSWPVSVGFLSGKSCGYRPPLIPTNSSYAGSVSNSLNQETLALTLLCSWGGVACYIGSMQLRILVFSTEIIEVQPSAAFWKGCKYLQTLSWCYDSSKAESDIHVWFPRPHLLRQTFPGKRYLLATRSPYNHLPKSM